MEITFDGEAFDTEQRVIDSLATFIVQVTPVEGETFDAQLVRVDREADAVDGTPLIVRRFNDETGEPEGEPFTVLAKAILVY